MSFICLQILRHKPDFGSWFVGNEVSSEGSILYITKCDPLFMIIPYLIKQHKTNVSDSNQTLISKSLSTLPGT